jgi:hypothetical protein
MKHHLTYGFLMQMPLFYKPTSHRNKYKVITWDRRRYGDLPLVQLPLTPAERKAMNALGLRNMSELIMLDAGRFQKAAQLSDEEFGRFKRWLSRTALSNPRLAGPPQKFSPRSVKLLPFFAVPMQRAYVPESLAPSFHPDADVDQLDLSFRSRKVLNRLGIRTIGQLLLTRADKLRTERNLGEVSVQKTRRMVVDYLRLANSPTPPAVDYGSFARMLESFLRLAFGRKEVGEMMILRLGWTGDRVNTWKAIGNKFGYTNVRISQLVKAGLAELRSPRKHVLLDRFWQAAADVHRSSGGDLDAMRRALAQHFKWRRFPPENVLKQVLDLNPEMKVSN